MARTSNLGPDILRRELCFLGSVSWKIRADSISERLWCIERHSRCLLADEQRKDNDMGQLLESLQNTLQSTGFVIWVRESPTVLAYPTILAAHTFGMAFLVGLSGMIALRILGFAPGLPLAPLERFFPLIWVGFWVNAVSGVVLLSLTPADFLTDAAFYIKLLGVAGAVASVRWLRTNAFGDPASLDTKPVPMKSKVLAVTTLTCWAVAILGGRVVAYEAFVGWETTAAVLILTVVLVVGYNAARRLWLSNRPAREARATTTTGY